MKFLRTIPFRLIITMLLIIFQMLFLASLATTLMIMFPLIMFAGYAISILVFLYVLKKDDASVYKVTWVIVVLLVPALGGIIYMIFSKQRPSFGWIVKHAKEHALIAKSLDNDGSLSFENQVDNPRMFSLFKYTRQTSSYHAYNNTKSKYYPLGELMFEDMLKELEKAEKYIFLEYFIVKKSSMWKRLVEVLERKAAEGVEIKLLVDHLGSARLFTRAYRRELKNKNINVLMFNPMIPFILVFMNNRDHRKIMVVDGKTAFVGGLNIADEYINKNKRLGKWKDTGIRLKGDAVWSFTLMFIEMWDTFCKPIDRITDHLLYKHTPTISTQHSATAHCISTNDVDTTDGFILPYGCSPLSTERMGENIYIDILNQAERYVYIFTPYLIISEKMIHAIQMAAKRGVDVRIVMPGTPDKRLVYRLSRSYYRYLLDVGVKIYEYSPGFLHAKSFVCDDKIAVVGTINLDYRSLYLHFECAVLLYNSGTILDMKNDVLKTLGESREVAPITKSRFALNELLDAVLHLFAPLL